MARVRAHNESTDVQHVEAITAGVALIDGTEYVVREASVWTADGIVPRTHPRWFVPLGHAPLAQPFIPDSNPDA